MSLRTFAVDDKQVSRRVAAEICGAAPSCDGRDASRRRLLPGSRSPSQCERRCMSVGDVAATTAATATAASSVAASTIERTNGDDGGNDGGGELRCKISARCDSGRRRRLRRVDTKKLSVRVRWRRSSECKMTRRRARRTQARARFHSRHVALAEDARARSNLALTHKSPPPPPSGRSPPSPPPLIGACKGVGDQDGDKRRA